jgi:hypothetical protein
LASRNCRSKSFCVCCMHQWIHYFPFYHFILLVASRDSSLSKVDRPLARQGAVPTIRARNCERYRGFHS